MDFLTVFTWFILVVWAVGVIAAWFVGMKRFDFKLSVLESLILFLFCLIIWPQVLVDCR